MPLTKHPREQYIYHPYPIKADLSTFYDIVSDAKGTSASSGTNTFLFPHPADDEIHTITHLLARDNDSAIDAIRFILVHNGSNRRISQKLNPDVNETHELIQPVVFNKDCNLKVEFMNCTSGDYLGVYIIGYKTLTYY